MPEKDWVEKKHTRICLLGASFDTGNMGVSALAESSIKVILYRWPDAEIILLGSGYKPRQRRFFLLDREVCVRTLPIRFSKNIFLPYHFLWFAFYGLIARLLPKSWLKDVLVNSNPYFRILFDTDLVLDINGGDSFSDIYSFRGFLLGCLRRWLVIFLGRKLILLPQTFGPFKRPLSKMLARYIMNHASLVYSRDRRGVEYVKDLLNIHLENERVRFAPDVAFVLDSRKPRHLNIGSLSSKLGKEAIVVGFNISGLLFSGGYTRDNMFNLKVDYRQLIYRVVDLLVKKKKVVVLLIPHVFPPANFEVESDPDACLKVYEQLNEKYPGRMFLTQGQGEYNHNEIKYRIGLCDFFIGSRLHACIAALSQCVPAVGIAYSRKFQGVFESVDMESCVVDARSVDREGILKKIELIFDERDKIRRHLKSIIPNTREKVLNIFEFF